MFRFDSNPRSIWAASLLGSVLAVGSVTAELPSRQPFAPKSAPRGATLFTELPSSRTGVVTENNYADPRMWGDRYQEFALGDAWLAAH